MNVLLMTIDSCRLHLIELGTLYSFDVPSGEKGECPSDED